MPGHSLDTTTTAVKLLSSYRARLARRPGEDRATLFKFLLWEVCGDLMVPEAELTRVARTSRTLHDLTLAALQLMHPSLSGAPLDSVRTELRRFFRQNAPDEV